MLAGATAAIEKARAAKNPNEINRQLVVLRQLSNAAYLRSPGAWPTQLDHCASRVSEASDPRRAAKLVEEGRAAEARRDDAGVDAPCETCGSSSPATPRTAPWATGRG